MKKKSFIFLVFFIIVCTKSIGQQSVAREWNEVLLEAIRKDYARPTVHARNLFHSAIIMYDIWAVFDDTAETVFLGKSFGNYPCSYIPLATPANIEIARHEAISYAMYRLLNHRFKNSPGEEESLASFENLFLSYGYDKNIQTTDYISTNSYAALGNYIANQIIAFGLQDKSNEENDYENKFYQYSNRPLILEQYEDQNDLNFPDKWQPLAFDLFIDQSGNPRPSAVPDFLSPEWGEVTPFSLKETDLEILNNGFNSYIYNNPGDPVYIQNSNENGLSDPYKWHFSLVASWSAHLDPNDPTLIDISPGAIGNVSIDNFPNSFEEYKAFYHFTTGGDMGTGHTSNPSTNLPYQPQLVKRADYARVLAEFWADGPDSETPPGHWFTILNYVNDHPQTIKKFGGEGETLSNLEWDVKSYLTLGGAMHDSAINTWGLKGYYDYVRPISAIRYMAGKGQSTNASLPNYDPHGIPLIPGSIEIIEAGDALAGTNNENVGKIKIYAWKGPDYISDPNADVAGVDWILGTHWWPYQRATFVTPPFAGYVSGHSTFSRAAAEVLTLFTGDAFFPGGMGVFNVEKENFLVFENGPSEGFTLQWATYRDASDQTSLSRIWGGIHPPIDDIPGRKIGDKIGKEAFALAKEYFNGTIFLNEDNFDVSVTNKTCSSLNNGTLKITAKNNLNYETTIDNVTYNFNEELIITGLDAKTYSFCITVTNNTFEKCFEYTIQENEIFNPILLINNEEDAYKATFEIDTGTPPYTLTINNAFITEHNSSPFEVFVKNGDKVEISTSIPCEGTFLKYINLEPKTIIYPNPTEQDATIFLTEDVNPVLIHIFNSKGQLLSSDTYESQEKKIELPTNGLLSGLYYIVLDIKKPETIVLLKK
ncbi:T9SS type A sorting domain-containing protein [uncultured Maribacter sp.]|uniref:T9SS type A sorting domain-containing protein n=1 Tax=uncultured Maribacter sp. TaxID=431308 RepID=UPI002623CB21|nr:T9SS type A sorting domain-containing protein [uncultured Maribacter sp.]